MRDSWLTLIDSVLRPARPELERCLRERELHVAARRLFTERRTRAIADCEARIESARAAVLAARDGLITSRMTELEREWRTLSRTGPEDRLMDLWARIAPASWIDRKRWRDSDPLSQLDAAVALAADVDGVEAAESAVDSFRVALAAWEVSLAARIRWRWFEGDCASTVELLAAPLRAARGALAARGIESVVVERAQQLEQTVHEAARIRLPERAGLARELAHAAFVDFIWRAASLPGFPDPVAPLWRLWTAGYVLSAIDASSVTLEIPRL